MPMCRADPELLEDRVNATSRSRDQLWVALHEIWTDLMIKTGTLYVNRSLGALEKQFKKIRKGVSTFTSHYVTVKNIKTTGNVTETDSISSSVAWSCWLDINKSV